MSASFINIERISCFSWQVVIGMDVAASEFYDNKDKTYDLNFKEEVIMCIYINLFIYFSNKEVCIILKEIHFNFKWKPMFS